MKLIGYVALGLIGLLTLVGLAMAGALVGVGGSTPNYSGESFAQSDNGYETSYGEDLAAGSIPRATGRWQLLSLPREEMVKAHSFWKDVKNLEKMEVLIQEMINKYKLPADQFLGIIYLESSWKPDARSEVGALGFSQFMPDTASEYPEFGKNVAERADNRENPFMSVQAMARKLSTDRANYNREYNKRNPSKPPLAIEWGTLEYAYRAFGKGKKNQPFLSYNPGVDISHWRIAETHATRFRNTTKPRKLIELIKDGGE